MLRRKRKNYFDIGEQKLIIEVVSGKWRAAELLWRSTETNANPFNERQKKQDRNDWLSSSAEYCVGVFAVTAAGTQCRSNYVV